MLLFSKLPLSVLHFNLLALHFPYVGLSHIIFELLSFLVSDTKRVLYLRLLVLDLNFIKSVSLRPLFVFLIKSFP
jgi:hypothetical protein